MKPICTIYLEFNRELFGLADTVVFLKQLVKDNFFKLANDTRYYTIDEVDRLTDRLAWVDSLTIYKPVN